MQQAEHEKRAHSFSHARRRRQGNFLRDSQEREAKHPQRAASERKLSGSDRDRNKRGARLIHSRRY